MAADAVANIVMSFVKFLSIRTNIFKPHSLRGGAATVILAHGASQTLTRQRGGWSTYLSFDHPYAKLHQTDHRLGGAPLPISKPLCPTALLATSV